MCDYIDMYFIMCTFMYMTLWLHSCVDWYMNMFMCEWMLSAVLCVWACSCQWKCWHLSLTKFECPVIWSECYLCVNECVCMFVHVSRLTWMCSFVWMWECVPICVWMHECVFVNNCEPIRVRSHTSVKERMIFMFICERISVCSCVWVGVNVCEHVCVQVIEFVSVCHCVWQCVSMLLCVIEFICM